MPEEKCHVIVYGDSLILQGARSSLASAPDLDVFLLDPRADNVDDTIRALCPAVVIFDLQAVPPDVLLPLLSLSGLLLVGIEAETCRAVVWSGRQEAAIVPADLVSIVRGVKVTFTV